MLAYKTDYSYIGVTIAAFALSVAVFGVARYGFGIGQHNDIDNIPVSKESSSVDPSLRLVEDKLVAANAFEVAAGGTVNLLYNKDGYACVIEAAGPLMEDMRFDAPVITANSAYIGGLDATGKLMTHFYAQEEDDELGMSLVTYELGENQPYRREAYIWPNEDKTFLRLDKHKSYSSGEIGIGHVGGWAPAEVEILKNAHKEFYKKVIGCNTKTVPSPS